MATWLRWGIISDMIRMYCIVSTQRTMVITHTVEPACDTFKRYSYQKANTWSQTRFMSRIKRTRNNRLCLTQDQMWAFWQSMSYKAQVNGQIWSNFEIVQYFMSMYIQIICNEIKNNQTQSVTKSNMGEELNTLSFRSDPILFQFSSVYLYSHVFMNYYVYRKKNIEFISNQGQVTRT